MKRYQLATVGLLVSIIPIIGVVYAAIEINHDSTEIIGIVDSFTTQLLEPTRDSQNEPISILDSFTTELLQPIRESPNEPISILDSFTTELLQPIRESPNEPIQIVEAFSFELIIPDMDDDGIRDSDDNCPNDSNPNQEDLDRDGIGDVCDTDIDGDGVDNSIDNCRNDSNPSQNDEDLNGKGDACDLDIDGDGIINSVDQKPFDTTLPLGFSDETLGGHSIFVTTQHGGTNSRGELFSLAANGDRSVVTDFGDPTKGTLGLDPEGLAINFDGTILVVNGDINESNLGNTIIRVNPFTGDRTLVSDLKILGPEPTAVNLRGIAINDAGEIFVTDLHGGTELAASQGPLGALFKVNQFTGQREEIADFGDLSKGTKGKSPFFMDIEDSGDILVANSISSNVIGKIIRVDPDTGTRTLAFDFSNPATGTPQAIGTSVIKIEPGTGDWIIADFEATDGPGDGAALYRVQVSEQGSAAGQYSLITDFGVGPDELGNGALGFDFDSEGNILIADRLYPGTATARGAVWQVDSITGERSIFTNFGTIPVPVGAGPLGVKPGDVAVFKGGTTFGEVIDPGDQILTIVDEPNPDGIRIIADSSGGPTPAQISVCGGIPEDFFAGDNKVRGPC